MALTAADAWLLALVPGLPLLLAIATAFVPRPSRLLAIAPLPALAAALGLPPGAALALPPALLGAGLRLDDTGAVFLALCALLWTCAGAYAVGYLGGKPHERGFCAFWHLTLAGSLGACIAADVVSFYLCFAALSLAAWVLVIHDRTPDSLRAGRIYIVLAVAGEVALLVGLLLVTQAAGSIDIDAVRAALPLARWRDPALAALVAGLGMKAGLLPLHGWLPLAHSAAPVPASAVLSGAIVKAGILGLLRFLPLDGTLPNWGIALTWLGLATAWAGVLLGLAQQLPKAVLAYSTMSQMGLLVAVIGAGMGPAGDAAATQAAAAFQALHHGLAKAALFLAVGLAAAARGSRAQALLVVAALLGASMAGAPLTGGALAKLAAKGPMGEGIAATVAGLSGIGTLLLVLRFLHRLRLACGDKAQATAGMVAAFAAVALAALVVPGLAFAALVGKSAGAALQASALWSAAWPVLVALGIGGWAWRAALPSPAIAPGDIASWAESALRNRYPRGTTPRAQHAVRPLGMKASLLTRWARRGQSLGRQLATWQGGAGALVLLALGLGWALQG